MSTNSQMELQSYTHHLAVCYSLQHMTKIMLLLKMHRWEYVLLKRDCLKSRRHLLLQCSLVFHAMPFQAYLQKDGIRFKSWKKCCDLGSVEYFWFFLFIWTFLVLSMCGEIWPPSEKAWAGAWQWESLRNKPQGAGLGSHLEPTGTL